MGAILKTIARPTTASPSIPCHRCKVPDRAFCAGVEPEELQRLDAIATEVRLSPRQMVFFEGDPADFMFNVTRGMVRAGIVRANRLAPVDEVGYCSPIRPCPARPAPEQLAPVLW